MKGDVNAKHFIKLSEDFKLHCQFVELPDFNEVFTAVAKGKVDAGVVNNTFGAPKFKEFKLKPTGVVFNPFEIFFAVKKGKNRQIIQITDKYLSAWKREESSVYNRSRQKWSHGTVGSIEVFPQWLSWMLGAFMFCILLALVFIYTLKKQVIKATATIKASEIKLRSYIDNAPDGVCIIDNNGVILEANPATSKITGLSSEKIVTKHLSDIISCGNTDSCQEWLSAFKMLNSQRYEGRVSQKSKWDVWVIVEAVKLNESRFLVFLKDITDKKEAELSLIDRSAEIEEQNEALIISKSKAEESDKLKSAFLQNLNHEIRTPLNAIMGFSELLPMVVTGNAKAEEYCQFIVQRGHDLLEIINGTLLIASIESDQLTVELNTLNVAQLLADLGHEFESFQNRYGKSNLNFVTNINFNDDNAIIETDIFKLKVILVNLLSNACKFTHQGSVSVNIKYLGGNDMRFEIADTGIGISEDKREHIFSRFYKIYDGDTPSYDGAGLGLPIAKSFVAMLGGKLEVISDHGKGTSFYFTLPCAKSIARNESVPIVQPEQQIKSKQQVLVVEDDMYNMLYITQLLEYWGIDSISASTGERGVKLALENEVSLVLMDIKLPDITGYDAASQIKLSKPGLPIIAQTGFASHEDAQHAYKCGFSDYVSKPIATPEFKVMMHKYLDF